MKSLKLLNNKDFSIISILFLLFFTQQSFANDPVDIWNNESVDKNKEIKNQNKETEEKTENQNSIYETNLQKITTNIINEEKNITLKETNIIGIYDPSDHGLSINMWSYSDGEKIVKLVKRINRINLSKDADEILEILFLTNAHLPKKNITEIEFLDLKSNWLIKHNDLKLIEDYLSINKNLQNKSDLITFYINEHLSRGDIKNSCEIFKHHHNNFEDNYLSKFKIYCLLNDKKYDEAQLQLDLAIETGFKDKFFESKFYHLIGYEKEEDTIISEKNLLDFHLSYLANSNFTFNPKLTTSKLIWRYLSSFNLLASIESVDLENEEEILIVEKATHDQNYKESDLFDLYRRFMFNINQLLTVEQSFKVMPNHKARALLYQGILLAKNSEEKINLIKILKESFINENISRAFDEELIKLLKSINKDEVTSDHSSFYNFYLESDENKRNKIKFNNKILHQSKILSYFIEENYNSRNIQKDLDTFLKKAKKNKKYFFSTKDIILIESLISDGIEISKKYDEMFELNQALVPDDIQFLINNNETGLVLLRLVEMIGQDMISDMDVETVHFIVNVLNQLNIDKLRNKILIKVLPLKV
jgi:hypothetical protein